MHSSPPSGKSLGSEPPGGKSGFIRLSIPARYPTLAQRRTGASGGDFMFKKVLLAILDNFEGYVSQILLAFFVLILLLQIFLRQFGHPLYWTEELARYSFVWFVFFGASYAARLAAHNRVTIQFYPFPQWVGDACMLISDGVWLFFNIVMVVESLEVIGDLREFPYATPALDWQLSSIYFIFPIAFTLMSARIIQVNVMKFILKKELPPPDRIEVKESRKAFADGEKV